MKKSISFGIILFLLFSFSVACSPRKPIVYIHSGDNLYGITVEIADNDQERARGLMERESVPENTGMFFVYPKDIKADFWMKNMKVPIDMIFITSDRVIDTIRHNAPPCSENETCAHYRSEGEVRYVLEVRAGYAEDKGIEPGDQISFEHFQP